MEKSYSRRPAPYEVDNFVEALARGFHYLLGTLGSPGFAAQGRHLHVRTHIHVTFHECMACMRHRYLFRLYCYRHPMDMLSCSTCHWAGMSMPGIFAGAGLSVAARGLLLAPGHAGQHKKGNQKRRIRFRILNLPTYSVCINPVAASVVSAKRSEVTRITEVIIAGSNLKLE